MSEYNDLILETILNKNLLVYTFNFCLSGKNTVE